MSPAPPTAGYSGTPLVKKLGLRPGMRVAFLEAPDGFEGTLGALPDGVVAGTRLGGHKELKRAVAPDGMVWVAWPKRASGVATDVTEDVIRDVVLPTGLVDVKVCAIDDTWSGLKLVLRKALR
jgi:hypothetical protein